jgi:quercetin dioxygenase-like cupin family protein
MKTSRLAAVTIICMAAAFFLTRGAGGDESKKATALTADALTWEALSAKGPDIKIATVSGDHTKGAWAGFIKFPAGSKSGIHTHSSDIKIVVVSGSFHYGPTPETEKSYGAGSYVLIPADLPHSNSQPEGALLYSEQPGKFDSNPVK